MIKKPKFIITAVLFTFIASSIFAQNKTEQTIQNEILSVAIAGHPPFILNQNKIIDGISYQIWQNLANKARFSFKTTEYDNVNAAFKALKAGKADILVGPISITADRCKAFSFSQPYFQSSLSLMSIKHDPTFWERISAYFSAKSLWAIVVFLFILSIVGALLWLAERKESPNQFPPEPAKGILNGMWLAIVTMTTTGYGDKAPITFWGRVIAGAWMVVSIIFATTMVAGIASTLTLSGMKKGTITKISQLTNKKVAVIKDSPAASYITSPLITKVSINSLEEGYEMLKNKAVAAVFYDRPQLQYFVTKHNDKELFVSNEKYYQQGYGFAFPLHSQLAKKVNFYLLKLNEAGVTNRIVESWLGNDNNKEE